VEYELVHTTAGSHGFGCKLSWCTGSCTATAPSCLPLTTAKADHRHHHRHCVPTITQRSDGYIGTSWRGSGSGDMYMGWGRGYIEIASQQEKTPAFFRFTLPCAKCCCDQRVSTLTWIRIWIPIAIPIPVSALR